MSDNCHEPPQPEERDRDMVEWFALLPPQAPLEPSPQFMDHVMARIALEQERHG